MLKYLHFLLLILPSIYTNAQEVVYTELRNETIDEFRFPIKIGQITSNIKSKEIGFVRVPELSKDYPLKFKESIVESIAGYIAFLESGETYKDTVHIHIERLSLREKIKANMEESYLDLSIEFYTTKNDKKHTLGTFSDIIMISDPNVTQFHEYNIRNGLNQSFKWFVKQSFYSRFKVEIQNKENQDKIEFIQSTKEPNTFIINNKLVHGFNSVELMASKLNDPTINKLIRKRELTKSIGSWFAGAGTFTGLIGYATYRAGDETAGSNMIVGGVVSFLLGTAIWHSGMGKYESNLIQEYNKVKMEQREVVFSPYNPIKIGFGIPLR